MSSFFLKRLPATAKLQAALTNKQTKAQSNGMEQSEIKPNPKFFFAPKPMLSPDILYTTPPKPVSG